MRNVEQKIYPRRLMVLKVFTFAFGLLLICRLFQVQVLLHPYYDRIATQQHQDRVKIELPRGRIFDRRGTVLALDIPRTYSFGVHPAKIKNKKKLAHQLARATGIDRKYYLERLNSPAKFVWLARQLDLNTAKPILKIPDLVKECESRRYYPFDAHTPKAVGFTDLDRIGIAGSEQIFNDYLESIPGWETVLADAFGKMIENPVYSRLEPVPGADLMLTFDYVVQELLCNELNLAVDQYNAKGAMGIIMLPRTGEILALASMPNFNPNCSSIYGASASRERNIVDMFEPGSTFKLVPALCALEKGVPVSKPFFCENGKYRVGVHIIEDVHPHGTLSFEEIIIKSSNIGAAKIVALVGAKSLYQTARDLGFGAYTGIEIPGEAKGMLTNPNKWDKYLLATIGMGQGVSVTALQLACAYSAVANDGILLRPRMVRSLIKPGGEAMEFQPIQVRRVAKRKTADKLTQILVKVVENGTGKSAQIESLKIAGKTGTAQKPLPDRPGYSEDKFMSSFIGYSVDEPRILCLIIIDEPQGLHLGGGVAAPVFKRVMEKTIPIVAAEQKDFLGPFKNQPQPKEPEFIAPDLLNLTANNAIKVLKEMKLRPYLVGNGTKVCAQYPLPGEFIFPKDTVKVFTSSQYSDLPSAGVSARIAARELISAGFKVNVIGSGLVSSVQFNGDKCTLFCNHSTRAVKKT